MIPEYSIIVPAYNEADELPETVKALRAAMNAVNLHGELIVVDNNSTDNTRHIAKSSGADKVVFEPVNQIARARNAGAADAKGSFLIFVDADTRIRSELLKQALFALETGEIVGGGSIVRFEGPQDHWVGNVGIRSWEHISRLTKTAAGSFLFCTKEAFDVVGGFDEKLYASEEVRLSRLLRKEGKKRDQRFIILDQFPAMTSPRKLKWYSGLQILGWVAFLFVMPLAVRSRKLCGFWYKRPV